MSEPLKLCPFCGEQLIKRHQHYLAVNNKIVDYDYYEHPFNGCFLEERCCEMGAVQVEEIDAWNRRADK